MVHLRTSASVLLLATTACILPLVATATTAQPLASARYEFGSGQPVDTFDDRGFSVECADVPSLALGGWTLALGPVAENKELPRADTPEVHAGGACFALAPGTYAVDVVDDLGGAPAFWLGAEEGVKGNTVSLDLGGPVSYVTGAPTEYFSPCEPHERTLGQGLRLFTLDPACGRIIVLPAAGALPGTIRVWNA